MMNKVQNTVSKLLNQRPTVLETSVRKRSNNSTRFGIEVGVCVSKNLPSNPLKAELDMRLKVAEIRIANDLNLMIGLIT